LRFPADQARLRADHQRKVLMVAITSRRSLVE
jgi:hypothetical protein